MQITLRHQGTGDVKVMPTGWSWSFFLGASFFGLPLFLRGLSFWGAVMMVAWAIGLAIPHLGVSAADADLLGWLHMATVTGLAAFLGCKGNALSIAHYTACGYRAIGTDSIDERIAARLWDH